MHGYKAVVWVYPKEGLALKDYVKWRELQLWTRIRLGVPAFHVQGDTVEFGNELDSLSQDALVRIYWEDGSAHSGLLVNRSTWGERLYQELIAEDALRASQGWKSPSEEEFKEFEGLFREILKDIGTEGEKP